jgi:hypothetical protein
MKNRDQILMEQAYQQVVSSNIIIDEKVSWRGAVAGAALGLGAMAGNSHAADNVTNHNKTEMVSTSKNSSESGISPQKAYEAVVDLVHSGQKKLPDNLIRAIVRDGMLTKNLAHFLTLQQVPLPAALKAVVGNYDAQLKSSLIGP